MKIRLGGRHRDKYTTVDEDDYEWLSQYNWYFHDGYASTRIEGKTVYMHRLVMATPRGMHTDHLNHDKLDNRKKNLRICTREENMQNQKRGIGCVKMITINGYKYWVGEVRRGNARFITITCKTEEQAAGALKQMIKDKGI
jgi:hypothetical protein